MEISKWHLVAVGAESGLVVEYSSPVTIRSFPQRKPLQGIDIPSGADRDRTGDPLVANQVLSQLSYRPESETSTQVSRFACPSQEARSSSARTMPYSSAQSRGSSMASNSASNDPGG
jgi:hypothetical protein